MNGFDARRVIYIHIPKTAGTSIAKSLGLRDSHDTAEMRYQQSIGMWYASKRFSVVRNPWDHAVSWWLYSGLWRKTAFNDWAMADFAHVDLHGMHPLEQLGRLHAHGGMGMQRIWRFERLEEDWPEIVHWVGVPDSPPLCHIQQKHYEGRRPYPEYYSEASRVAVAQRQSVLIDGFGYRFGA